MESCKSYIFDRQEQFLFINGIRYSSGELLQEQWNRGEGEVYNDLAAFLRDWFNESPYVEVQTSGSTGIPKLMQVEKKRMMRSANLTCRFLNMKVGDTALLCLPLKYIAGKMMVVRALIAGLDLIIADYSGNPLKNIDIPLQFAAMIPLQVYNSLRNIKEYQVLKDIKKLIIGGGSIDPLLEKQLIDFPGQIYSTYGMTETLSHVALRKVNGSDASLFYTPFDTVGLSLSPDDTLVINAPLVSETILITNDIAEIRPDGTFRIKGRKDNVINSGGVKIQIEEVEQLLLPLIHTPFAITGIPHPKFGEQSVLVVEGVLPEELQQEMKDILPEYWLPKMIISISRLPMTGNGKKSRSEIQQLAIANILQK